MTAQEYHTTATPIGPWQRPDGWPSAEYFQAVADALEALAVPVDHWSVEEDWEAVYLIGDQEAPRSWAVAWRCDELDEPLTEGLTGLAWYRTDGRNVWSFDLGHLEDPQVVADEIAAWWAAETPIAASGAVEHGLPARLGGFWLSLPCRTGEGECDGTGGCACTCHAEPTTVQAARTSDAATEDREGP